MEYVITEKTEKYGWCLFRVCGLSKEVAEQSLIKEQAKHPDKELRIETVEDKHCWWNDPFLAN